MDKTSVYKNVINSFGNNLLILSRYLQFFGGTILIEMLISKQEEGRFILHQEWYFRKELTPKNFANWNMKRLKQTDDHL